MVTIDYCDVTSPYVYRFSAKADILVLLFSKIDAMQVSKNRLAFQSAFHRHSEGL